MKIKVHTEVNPEDNAMLQALYSRSAESVDEHLQKLAEVGSGKFMSQYYLGYGHASIADCGFITIYIEGVSMLAAKAIQDNPLYNGQESSSRYIDWSEQPFHNPYSFQSDTQGKYSEVLLNIYREFYKSEKPVIIEHSKELYPRKADEKETIYDKAIAAKAFDILRGFLPCGALTNVSWTTSLRKANEHISYLSNHPLNEVRVIARYLHAVLIDKYPNSIAPLPNLSEVSEYVRSTDHYYSQYLPKTDKKFGISDNYGMVISHMAYGYPRSNDGKDRERKTGLYKHSLSNRDRVKAEFNIDFGSYRDLQRHRGGYCSVPIINYYGGFNEWYFNQLPESSKVVAKALFNEIDNFAETIPEEDLEQDLKFQYLLPMGTMVPILLDYDLHQAVYVAELRSSQTVHATLRPVAQSLGVYLQNELGIKTYCDFTEDSWNLRRGTQDIIKK